MINHIEGVPLQFLKKLRAHSLLPHCYIWMANQWMHLEIFRERIIQNNPLGLHNESERSVERPQRLWTNVCTHIVSIDLLLFLLLPPSSSIYYLVWYLQCPHFCSPPPWLLHAWGFFLDWSLQWKILWWKTLGASFVLATVNFWKWDHVFQFLPSPVFHGEQ